jgi:hypothetical protein
MMKKISLLFVVLMGGTLSGSVQGATYYVTKTGNDNNPGTQVQPWLTIGKAANTVVAGDRVIIGNGSYNEFVSLSANGTSGSPIVFAGVSQAATVTSFRVSGNFNVVSNLSIGPVGNNQNGVTVGSSTHNNLIAYCRFDYDALGLTASGNAISLQGTSNTFDHCQMFRFRNATLILVKGEYNRVTSCLATNLHSCDFAYVFGYNHVIASNEFAHGIYPAESNHPDFIQTFGDNYDSCTNIIIEANYVHDIEAQLFMLTKDHDTADIHHLIFRNNIFANVSMMGQTAVPYTMFYNNVFYKCGYGNSGGAFGFGWSASYPDGGGGTGGKVYNNVFLECGEFPANPAKGWWDSSQANGGIAVDSNNNYFGGTSYAAKTGVPDANPVNGGDPKFVSIANRNFGLQAGSPLIGKGVTVVGFATDKAGNTRTVPWDIGAYEFEGTNQPSGTPAPPRDLSISVGP